MKVLHVAETAKGGVGTYLAQLAPLQRAMLGDAGVRIVLPDQHAFQAGEASRPLMRTFDRPGRSLATLALLARTVRDEVDRFRPDVIHAHSTFAGLVVRLLYGWRRDRPRIIYCPHGWAFDVQSGRAKKQAVASAERMLAGWCDRVIVISRHEEAQALRIGIAAHRLACVMNGIAALSPVPPAAWDDPRLKVMFIGRLDHQKGFDTLLDAIEPHADRICLRAAGEAVVGAVAHRRSNQVEQLGWLSAEAIAGHLAAADVVAVPSRWEGFGLVALEAMRASRMVVASAIGGLAEIVQEGVTGRLTDPDTPVQLAHALLRDGPKARTRMGAAGRQRFVDHFTAERMAAELLTVYAQAGVAAPALR